MSVYKRGDAWWYKFRFAGQVIRESTKSDSRTVGRALKRAKLRKLIRECGKKLSRREIIELRAGRSKRPHRKNQELLVAILRKFGRI